MAVKVSWVAQAFPCCCVGVSMREPGGGRRLATQACARSRWTTAVRCGHGAHPNAASWVSATRCSPLPSLRCAAAPFLSPLRLEWVSSQWRSPYTATSAATSEAPRAARHWLACTKEPVPSPTRATRFGSPRQGASRVQHRLVIGWAAHGRIPPYPTLAPTYPQLNPALCSNPNSVISMVSPFPPCGSSFSQ